MLEALSLPFLWMALAAGLLVGCLCAYLGIFLILKRIVFVGAALSQIAAAGLALGLVLQGWVGGAAGGWPELARMVSLLVTMVGIVLFWIPVAERRVSRESLIGYAYAAAGAVTVLLVARSPRGELRDLDLLSGNLLFIDRGDLVVIATITTAVGLLHAALRKEFLLVTLDLDTATAAGLPGRRYELLIYGSVGLTIAASMRLVGVLFVFASLVIPALTGLLLARRLPQAMLFAVATAAVGVVGGLFASFWLDLPTGAAVVAAYALLFLPAAVLRRLLVN
jgi:ABC-type Mn2+/Zn2+ transport system permease subunit